MGLQFINVELPRPVSRPKYLTTYTTQRGEFDEPRTYHVSNDFKVVANKERVLEIELMGHVMDIIDICELEDTYPIVQLIIRGKEHGYIPIKIRKSVGVIDYAEIAHLVRLGILHGNPDIQTLPIDIKINDCVVYDRPTVEYYSNL